METNLECPEELNDEFKVLINQSLLGWMVGDARTAELNEAYVGSLILGICALDVLGGFYCGVKRTSNETFKKFIKEYLPHSNEYLSRNVYTNMRNKLVHAYSTKGFKYTSDHPEKHLIRDGDGRLWIHVHSFINEVEQATRSYIMDLPVKDELWTNFKQKWSRDPLLRPIPE